VSSGSGLPSGGDTSATSVERALIDGRIAVVIVATIGYAGNEPRGNLRIHRELRRRLFV